MFILKYYLALYFIYNENNIMENSFINSQNGSNFKTRYMLVRGNSKQTKTK